MNLRPLGRSLWYDLCQFCSRIAFLVFFGVRVRGQRDFPRDGAVLLVSNHQSHLDPVLAGISIGRHLNSLARDTLFRVPVLRHVITWLDAIPLDREGIGLAGVKETLRRLKQGNVVLVFPEGTRTYDGRLAPLKPGFCALARRTRVPIQPMAVAGAFEAWPRWRSWPGPATIHVQFGSPITAQEIAALNDEQLVAEVAARLAACKHQAEVHRRRAVRELPALPAVRGRRH